MSSAHGRPCGSPEGGRQDGTVAHPGDRGPATAGTDATLIIDAGGTRQGDQMIVRQQATCPGCEQHLTVRISAFPTARLNFYLLCPECNSPLRGYIEGDELEDFTIELEGSLRGARDDESCPVVTINPSFPMHSGAEDLAHPWYLFSWCGV